MHRSNFVSKNFHSEKSTPLTPSRMASTTTTHPVCDR